MRSKVRVILYPLVHGQLHLLSRDWIWGGCLHSNCLRSEYTFEEEADLEGGGCIDCITRQVENPPARSELVPMYYTDGFSEYLGLSQLVTFILVTDTYRLGNFPLSTFATSRLGMLYYINEMSYAA